MDPDPAIFVTNLQDANKKTNFLKSFSAYYILKVHLHHFSKIKTKKSKRSHKTVGIEVFSHYLEVFLLDDRRIRIRIHTSDKRIRIQEAQKHIEPTDPNIARKNIKKKKTREEKKSLWHLGCN